MTDGWRLDSFLASHEPATRAPAAQPTALPDSAEGTWAPPPFEAVAARREAQSSGLVGRIEIPRVGLSAVIVEGTTASALRRGVGHVENTAFPGEAGNVALAGHRDTYFRKLREVSLGDGIRLTTPDGVFAYQVVSATVVPPERGDLVGAASQSVLTLVTCYPFEWIGPAPSRFVVRARPVAAVNLPDLAWDAHHRDPHPGSSRRPRPGG